MTPLLPDFVVIGAQKAASTFITECLRQHPLCYLPRGETHYFRDPFYDGEPERFFAKLFQGTEQTLRRGIKCPDYFATEHCAERIHRDLDEPQLLLALRDPVDRAISAYYWRMKWGRLPFEPAEIGLARILRGEYDRDYRHAKSILNWGLYARHLRRYLDLFPRKQLLIVLDIDIKADTQGTIQSVYSFLGLDTAFRPKTLERRKNQGTYSIPRLKFLDRRNKYVIQRAENGSYLRLARPRRPFPFMYNAAVVLADRWVLSRLYANDRPTLSGGLLKSLVQYYEDDMRDLEALLGRDLSQWRHGLDDVPEAASPVELERFLRSSPE